MLILSTITGRYLWEGTSLVDLIEKLKLQSKYMHRVTVLK